MGGKHIPGQIAICLDTFSLVHNTTFVRSEHLLVVFLQPWNNSQLNIRALKANNLWESVLESIIEAQLFPKLWIIACGNLRITHLLAFCWSVDIIYSHKVSKVNVNRKEFRSLHLEKKPPKFSQFEGFIQAHCSIWIPTSKFFVTIIYSHCFLGLMTFESLKRASSIVIMIWTRCMSLIFKHNLENSSKNACHVILKCVYCGHWHKWNCFDKNLGAWTFFHGYTIIFLKKYIFYCDYHYESMKTI